MGSVLVRVLWSKDTVLFVSENPYEVKEHQLKYQKSNPEKSYFINSVKLNVEKETPVIMKSTDGSVLKTTSSVVRSKMFPTEMD